jgi:Flp pilus assembly pilin Flp
MRPRSLLRDSRGANLVEYLVVIGLVAVVAIAGFRAFGGTATSKSDQQADCVKAMDGSCGKAGATEGSDKLARGMPPPVGDEPDFGKVKDVGDAKYVVAKGTPGIEGPGDGREYHPSDISQGQIGDCWLMSSLAAIAHRNPDVLKNNIKDNGDGTYTVSFYEQRFLRGPKKIDIVVKAEFPQRNGTWWFAKPGDKKGDQEELWPMLYEKAYAQWKGGYDKIVGGQPSDAMEAITGKSSDWHRTTGLWDMSFSDFADYNDKNAVVAATPSKGDGKKVQLIKDGVLYAEHAYWVESVDRDKQTVTVRNPWGWNEAPITLSWDDFKKGFPVIYVNPTR